MNRTCIYCKKEFTPKRFNQTYCSKTCRMTYHNHNARELRHQTRDYTNGIFKNYKILRTLFKENGENGIYSKDFLLGAGYKFSLLSHSLTDRNKAVFNFCFDYALNEVQENKFKILNYVHKL